jgi:MinD-like ATPase involved in chromosome partitioning or flagellar assembly
VLKIHRFRTLAQEAEAQNQDAIVQSPETLLDVFKNTHPEEGKRLEVSLRAFQFKLIVNQMRRQDNPKIGILICKVIERHLGLKIQFLGNISFDENVHEAVCKKEPFIDQYRYSQATLELKAVVKGIVGTTEGQAATLSPTTSA